MLDVKFKFKPGHSAPRVWMACPGLRQLFWNVTYACDHRCGICFADAGGAHHDELTTVEARAMVLDARAAGVRDIIISGGEPFLRPDMLELLAFMGAQGITARIASNGSLLTDDLLRRLRAETKTLSFQISLDTPDPELYSRLHGVPAAAFGEAVAATRRVRRHGFHTTISTRLTTETLAGLPRLLDMAAQEGWATVTAHCPLHLRRARGSLDRGADVLVLLEPSLEHFAGLLGAWLIETYIPWAEYHPVMRHLAERLTLVHRGCGAGRDRLTVQPSGDITPCVCMDVPEAYSGNVRRDRLADVFERAPLCRMMRRPWEHGVCADCEHVRRCGGGCRSEAFVLTGRLDGPDTNCPLLRS